MNLGENLEWSVPTCKDHSGMPVGAWDKVVPAAAITPEVARWLKRRGEVLTPVVDPVVGARSVAPILRAAYAGGTRAKEGTI